MINPSFIPLEEFLRVREARMEAYERLALIADMCRANALAAIKRAGSGHVGSSFSAMDIVVWLYYQEMNTLTVGLEDPDRDVYFSSKGHDVPGLYAVLFSLGILPEDGLLRLRRLGGLDGHPDIRAAGIEANSGSLGMGISKGRGMAWAKRLLHRGGRVFITVGDGELQEGQNYEALQGAAHHRLGNLVVIVDHNKVQSDKEVRVIMDLGDLEGKFRAFGWQVARCDGHSFAELDDRFRKLREPSDRPWVLIADTIKGRGVSFMEHPAALRRDRGLYAWHAGAPGDERFLAAHQEILGRIDSRLAERGLLPLQHRVIEPPPTTSVMVGALGEPTSEAATSKAPSVGSPEYVADAFGLALVAAAKERTDIVVLDADLAADCRIRAFEDAFPHRFIENGIAEQDMVSVAGGLAKFGLLPVVNSFASFLAARANEQIYNNATEGRKIVYAFHYAGLIPAGPGKSHQSIRDISLIGALPNCVILEPCNSDETRMIVDYCLNSASESCVIRLVIGPSPRTIALPESYALREGRGAVLREGRDAVVFAYGPVMLHEVLRAAELLEERGLLLRVVNMPWLNRVDRGWLGEVVNGCRSMFVVEDHSPTGGLGDFILSAMVADGLLGNRRFENYGVCGYPACGTPSEALGFHRLDGPSLADRILAAVSNSSNGRQ